MPARKWKTDRRTESPKAGVRYWLTIDDVTACFVISATWDGMEWIEICGPEDTPKREELPGLVKAWMPQSTKPEPWTDPDFEVKS